MNAETKYCPLGIDFEERVQPVPPDDLAEKVSQLFLISRFVHAEYPQGIFDDNVGKHTTRLAVFISLLPEIKNVRKDRLERMSWLHDEPELITGDTVAPRKADTAVAKKLAAEEAVAIDELLEGEDLQLLDELNSSGDFLKGELHDLAGTSPEGFILYVLDKIDGNMFFHFSLAKWLAEDDGQRVFSDQQSLAYTFRQREVFMEALEKVEEEFPEVAKICRSLLDAQIDYVRRVWQEVDPARQPQEIKDELQK